MEISLVFQEHPDDDIWDEYAFGRLDPRREEAVEEHLFVCETCRLKLEAAGNYIRSMKTAAAQLVATPPKARWKIIPFPAAKRPAQIASVTAIAVAAAVLWVGPLRSSRIGTTAPATVALESIRAGGAASLNRAPAKRALDLSIRLADVPPARNYRLEVVTHTGRTVWSGVPARSQFTLSAHVAAGAAPGMYWVRLYGDSSELLAEYGLKLE